MAPQWFACRLDNLGRYILVRYSAKELAIEADKTPKRRLAKPQRLVEHLIKDGLKVAGRRIDDLKDFGGRGLLLQGLARLGQQPRILDRDDRLVGKGAHQLDLPLGERLDPVPAKDDQADRLTVAQ